MAVELAEYFLSPRFPIQSLSGKTVGDHEQHPISTFVSKFMDYTEKHFHKEVKLTNRPTFFLYMFFGSIVSLQKTGLLRKLNTNEIFYKINYADKILKVAYKASNLDGTNSKLVLRIIDVSGGGVSPSTDQSDAHYFTADEIDEILHRTSMGNTKEVEFIKEIVDYWEIFIEQTTGEMSHRPTNTKFVQFFLLGQEVKYPTFSSILDGTNHQLGEFAVLFVRLFGERDDLKLVETSGKQLVSNLKDIYQTANAGNTGHPFTSEMQSGFITGALIINLKERNGFDVFADVDLKGEILLNAVSHAAPVGARIPVIIKRTNSDDIETLKENIRDIKVTGAKINPLVETDFNLALYVLTNSFGQRSDTQIMSTISTINRYQGFVTSILDFCDSYTERLGEKTFDEQLKHHLDRELSYVTNILNDPPKDAIDKYTMGQFISSDYKDLRSYKLEYLSISPDQESASTYMLLAGSTNMQIVLNIMHDSDAQFNDLMNPDGKIIPHPLKIMEYDSLMINVIVDEVNSKNTIDVTMRKVDLNQWFLKYKNPSRLSFNEFLVNNGVIFHAYERLIMNFCFNKVVSLSSENTKRLSDLLEVLHSTFSQYFQDEKGFTILLKGASADKFQLLHSMKKLTDLLAVRCTPEIWHSEKYRYTHISDTKENILFIKIVNAGADTTEYVAIFNKHIGELKSVVTKQILDSVENAPEPISFILAFTSKKNFMVRRTGFRIKEQLKQEATSSGLQEIESTLSQLCLSQTHRKKRLVTGCLFSWDDVIQFSKHNSKSLEDLKIDEDKFLEYIKGQKQNDERKAMQLVKAIDELSEKQKSLTGNYKIWNMIKQSRFIQKLNGISKTSHTVMRSLMLKNIARYVMQGDWKDLGANVGFIAGSHVSIQISEHLKNKAIKMTLKNQYVFRNALRVSAPFVGRFASAYNVYHLWQSIKSYKNNGSDEALASVISDGAFIAIDTFEICAELLETFGAVEGLTAVAFPVGTALAAVVMIGAEIYGAVKTFQALKKIENEIHLSTSEKFVEGFRSILGLGFDNYVPLLVEEKRMNEHLVQERSILFENENIEHIVFSSQPVCKNLGKDCENSIILLNDSFQTHWSRAKPEHLPNGQNLSCFNEMYIKHHNYYQQVINLAMHFFHPLFSLINNAHEDTVHSTQKSYFCHNAIGIRRDTNNYHSATNNSATYIDVGNGSDLIVGNPNVPNIILLGSGSKTVTGGQRDDTFILRGEMYGQIDGQDGENFLDLNDFSHRSDVSVILIDESFLLLRASNSSVDAFKIYNVIGRGNQSDIISCSTCKTKYIRGNGAGIKGSDNITIQRNDNCTYNMQIVINGNARVTIKALKGQFFYKIEDTPSNVFVDVVGASGHAVQHTLLFDFKIKSVLNIVWQDEGHLNVTTTKGLQFCMQLFQKKNEGEIEIVFSDGVELKFDKSGRYVHGFLSLDILIKALEYVEIAEKLQILFTVFFPRKNETMLIGHSNSELKNNSMWYHTSNVIRNDPQHNCHLFGGNGEHVYVIDFDVENISSLCDFVFKNVTIYFYKGFEYWNLTDVINIDDIAKKLEMKFNVKINLEAITIQSDVIILVQSVYRNGTGLEKHNLFYIVLKNAVSQAMPWFMHVRLIRKVPIEIKVKNNSFSQIELVSSELRFGENITLILLTENDVRENSSIHIDRNVGRIQLCNHGSNLILLNFMGNNSSSMESTNILLTILLKDFFGEDATALHTLEFVFQDQKINISEILELQGLVQLNALMERERNNLFTMLQTKSPNDF